MCAHTLVGPLIRLGVPGFVRVTVRLRIPLTPQSFTACTVIALVLNPAKNTTEIVVSFGPLPLGCETMVVPFCAVQIYDCAAATFGMVYVMGTPDPMLGQTLVLEAWMAAGVVGNCAKSQCKRSALVPQADVAVTLNIRLALERKLLLTVTVMLFVP